MDFEKQRRIMVDSQLRVNDVTSSELVQAFMAVPKEAFVPKSKRSSAYAEFEIETTENRAIWTTRDLGKLLKELAPSSHDVGLVVGAGEGYSTAILAQIVDTVIGIDDNSETVEAMSERIARLGLDSAVAVEADLAVGLAEQGPFDVILIGGMVETVSLAWLDQLSEGGRLGVVVAVGRGIGHARIYTKCGETVSSRVVFECCPPVLAGFEATPVFEF